MHTQSEGINELETVLKQQHIHLVKMLAILRQEHQALSNNDRLQFEDAVQRKHQQARNLEKIQPLLNTVEKMIGGVLSKTSFAAYIQRVPNTTERNKLNNLWEDFQETLNLCDLQNKINNRILSASAINVKQALNILRGNTEQGTSNVYSETGQQQDNLQGQPLAIA